MKVIKRNSQEVTFEANKIRVAVSKANESVDELNKRLTDEQIDKIVKSVISQCQNLGRSVGVEEIQDMGISLEDFYLTTIGEKIEK